jgi:hypothetical protein
MDENKSVVTFLSDAAPYLFTVFACVLTGVIITLSNQQDPMRQLEESTLPARVRELEKRIKELQSQGRTSVVTNRRLSVPGV